MATIAVPLKSLTDGKLHCLIYRTELCCNYGVLVPETLCCTQAASVSASLDNIAIKSSLSAFTVFGHSYRILKTAREFSNSQSKGADSSHAKNKGIWVVLIMESHLLSQPFASHCLQNKGFASKHLLVWDLPLLELQYLAHLEKPAGCERNTEPGVWCTRLDLDFFTPASKVKVIWYFDGELQH